MNTGYTNMRCNWIPGCPDEIQYKRVKEPTGNATLDAEEEVKNIENKFPGVWHHFFGADSEVPEVVATQCCAQFAVSREQILKRPLSDYQRMHKWLMDTDFTDQVSGTIMEYMWHIIFGRDPVQYVHLISCHALRAGHNFYMMRILMLTSVTIASCPTIGHCYRDVYGREY
jgi:hypothetical protein